MSEGNGDMTKLGEPLPMPGATEEKIVVLRILLDKKTQRVEVEGLIGNKTLCFNVIGEAIKTIANFEPSPIVAAPKHGMMNFVRQKLGRH